MPEQLPARSWRTTNSWAPACARGAATTCHTACPRRNAARSQRRAPPDRYAADTPAANAEQPVRQPLRSGRALPLVGAKVCASRASPRAANRGVAVYARTATNRCTPLRQYPRVAVTAQLPTRSWKTTNSWAPWSSALRTSPPPTDRRPATAPPPQTRFSSFTARVCGRGRPHLHYRSAAGGPMNASAPPQFPPLESPLPPTAPRSAVIPPAKLNTPKGGTAGGLRRGGSNGAGAEAAGTPAPRPPRPAALRVHGATPPRSPLAPRPPGAGRVGQAGTGSFLTRCRPSSVFATLTPAVTAAPLGLCPPPGGGPAVLRRRPPHARKNACKTWPGVPPDLLDAREERRGGTPWPAFTPTPNFHPHHHRLPGTERAPKRHPPKSALRAHAALRAVLLPRSYGPTVQRSHGPMVLPVFSNSISRTHVYCLQDWQGIWGRATVLP